MSDYSFPSLALSDWQPTFDSLHHYARSLNLIRRALTPPQKHWAHTSLRVNSTGLTTTPMPCDDISVEIALDLITHRVILTTSRGERWETRLHGQTLTAFWNGLNDAMAVMNIHPNAPKPDYTDAAPIYEPAAVERYWRALSQVDLLLKQFQGGLREETSPVQFWAHHFDLAMLWFSGRLVPGQDPGDEETADEQMNFGFSVGDGGIPEPYFYITAYPTPEGLTDAPLPVGAYWQTEGWTGAVLKYSALIGALNPDKKLLEFWTTVQKRGAEIMRTPYSI